MCSYNMVDGIYACGHHVGLQQILEHEFGFDGWVVSDWNAAHSVTDAADGLDMERPYQKFFLPLKTAVLAGVVPVQRLDDMVYRVLFSMFRLGLFDHPTRSTPAHTVSTPAHRLLALRAAEEGMVLLKNDAQLLPLTRHHLRIAVIGPVGKGGAGNVCGGGGSAAVSCRVVSALTAIRGRAAQDGDTVTFADGSDRVEAAAVAGAADVAIVFGYYTESEGLNRTSFSLDGSGDALISTVAAANPRTAVVLETGGPTLMPWNAEVRSIVEAWYPGVEAGPAIAAALFGDVNPSGHLPQTFPASANEVPTAGAPLRHNDVSPVEDYSEGLEVGYRWYDAQHLQPLYPFGYGLSYASYEFDGPHVARQGSGVDLSFRVTNTGQYDGATVAQVYVSDPPAAG